MCQSVDSEFNNILKQLHEHQQTSENFQHINSCVMSYQNIDFYDDIKMITKTNVMQHTINLNIVF